MRRIRFLTLAVGLLGALASTGFATPDRLVVSNERFFGCGKDTYAVLRTVHDNKGSYFHSRTTTTFIERSKDTSEVVREVLILDREETVDYDNMGKLPPKVVVHAKDGNEILGNLLEKWPEQGGHLTPEELGRFRFAAGNVRFDERLGLLYGKPAFDAWCALAPAEAAWTIEEGMEVSRTILLKVRWKEAGDEGRSSAYWVCVDERTNAQVRAFKHIQPIYLVAGTYDSKEKALEQASKWVAELKTLGYSAFQPAIWTVDRGRATPDYVIVAADSKYLIDHRKTAEVEERLKVHLVPMNNERFREWIPIPER